MKEEIVVFIEWEFLLPEGLSEIDAYILGFEGVSATLAELGTPFLEIGKDAIAIHSIGVHKVVGFLSHSEAVFSVVDLVLIRRIPIMISVHFLY